MMNEWVAVAAINTGKNNSEISFTESHDNCLQTTDKSNSQVRAYKSWENRWEVSELFNI